MHKNFDDAQIITFYNTNEFVAFSPWFDGDNMVVSFIKKGVNGKTKVMIYLDLFKFEMLCNYISTGKFHDMLEKSNQDNPAFSYRTGNHGSKQLTIYKYGSNYTIHGYDAGQALNFNITCVYRDFLDLVRNYQLVVNRSEDNYWHQLLYDAFWTAYEKKSGFYQQNQTDEDKETSTDSSESLASKNNGRGNLASQPSEQPNLPQNEPKNNSKANPPSEKENGKNEASTGSSSNKPKPELLTAKVKTNNVATMEGNDLVVNVITQDNVPLSFVFPDRYFKLHKYDEDGMKIIHRIQNEAGVMATIEYCVFKGKNLVTKVS